MITYSIYLNNKFTTTLQAHSRLEAVTLAQSYKTQSMQRIHVSKESEWTER